MLVRRMYFAVIVTAALLASSTVAHADRQFTARSVKGAYGFTATGTLTAAKLPTVAVGIITFDGVAGCTSEAILNVDGTRVGPVAAATCSYTVNPDGTGTLLTTFPALGGAFTTDFVLVNNAKEFGFIISDTAQPGTTIASGVAKQQ